LAVQAAKVIQIPGLYRTIGVSRQMVSVLASVSQTINSTLNLDDALKVITREASALMRAKLCSLIKLLDESAISGLRASYGASETYLSQARLGVEESLLGIVVRRKSQSRSKMCSFQHAIKASNCAPGRIGGVVECAADFRRRSHLGH